MRFSVALWSLLAVAFVGGCSNRQQTSRCESPMRYSTARSVPPVQVPNDLSPPNEEEALRLPPDLGAAVEPPTEECLESPPAFSGTSRRGTRDAEPPAAPVPNDEPADPDRVIED